MLSTECRTLLTLTAKPLTSCPHPWMDWLPEGHLARFIVEVIEQLDLSRLVKQYAGRGCKAYHPATLLAILVYGYANGVFSSRKLEQATYDSVAFRYLAAGSHPDRGCTPESPKIPSTMFPAQSRHDCTASRFFGRACFHRGRICSRHFSQANTLTPLVQNGPHLRCRQKNARRAAPYMLKYHHYLRLHAVWLIGSNGNSFGQFAQRSIVSIQ